MNKSSSFKCRNFLKKYINYKKFPLYEFDNLIDCEAAKILENSYRAVNIAFIDEWTKFSVKTKLNLNKIIDAIKFRSTHTNIMRPGLGVGGYCLTKDPDFINFSGKYIFKKKFSFPITNNITKEVTGFYNVEPFPNYSNADNKLSIIEKGESDQFSQKLKCFIGYNKSFIEVGAGT